jgi:hypothetical protein
VFLKKEGLTMGARMSMSMMMMMMMMMIFFGEITEDQI